MIEVQALNKRDGKKFVFKINQIEIPLMISSTRLPYVTEMVQDIYRALNTLDILSFQSLTKKYSAAKVFMICNSLHEYIEPFIRYIFEQLIEEGKQFTSVNVMKKMGISYNTNLKQPCFELVYKIIHNIRSEYEDKWIEYIQKKDKNLVWKYTPLFPYKLKLVMRCVKLGEAFVDYLRYFAEELEDEDKLDLGYIKLYNYAFYGQINAKYIDSREVSNYLENNENPFKKIRTEIYLNKLSNIKTKKYRFQEDVWHIYSSELEVIKKQVLNFSFVQGELKHHIKLYIESLLKLSEKPKQVLKRLSAIRICMKVLQPYHLKSFWDLNFAHAHYLVDKLQQTNMSINSNRRYSLLSVNKIYIDFKLLLNWLIEEYNSDFENPLAKLSFNNVSSFSKPTKFIPEDVIEQLQNHLDGATLTAKTAWVIMMNSGMRISEVLNLEEDSLYYNDESKQWMLQYIPIKTSHTRETLFHTIPANDELVSFFNKQSEHTAELRRESNLKLIYCTKHYERITKTSQTSILMSINLVILKNQIRDNFGNIYHFSHHQCRKTVTTNLFSEGATLEEVANFIGHMSVRTTERSYKEMSNQNLVELESGFFKKYFEDFHESEELSPYTPEEREALLLEIKKGSRVTPEGHGNCLKHIVFGPCAKKKCAGCNFLITGPQHLPKWYQLYKEQQQSLNELETQYKTHKISDYENYRSYQKVKHDLTLYKTKIIETERTAKKAGITIERPKDLDI